MERSKDLLKLFFSPNLETKLTKAIECAVIRNANMEHVKKATQFLVSTGSFDQILEMLIYLNDLADVLLFKKS